MFMNVQEKYLNYDIFHYIWHNFHNMFLQGILLTNCYSIFSRYITINWEKDLAAEQLTLKEEKNGYLILGR